MKEPYDISEYVMHFIYITFFPLLVIEFILFYLHDFLDILFPLNMSLVFFIVVYEIMKWYRKKQMLIQRKLVLLNNPDLRRYFEIQEIKDKKQSVDAIMVNLFFLLFGMMITHFHWLGF